MSRTQPLETFHPLLKQAWKKAAAEAVAIQVKTKTEAIKLRQRLYKCRAALKQANDELYVSAQLCTIEIKPNSLSDPNGPATLVIRKADDSFEEALKAAGLDIPPAPIIDFG